MNILVTGGAGFIGAHLIRRLVEAGHDIRVLDNLSTGLRSRLSSFGDAISFLQGDICDESMVQQAVADIDIVFHLAALVSVAESVEQPGRAYATNVLGTVHVLEAARQAGVRRVVQASSCAVYGAAEQLPISERELPQPLSPYASTKLAAEHAGQLYTRLYGLEVVALRFFNVYGPGQDPASPYAAVIPRFSATLRSGEQPHIFGDGLQSRDFIYVGDIVRALWTAATAADIGGCVFNVGTGRNSSIVDLARLIGLALGKPVAPVFLPPRAGEVRHSCADVQLFAEKTGYRAETDLAAGLAATVG